MNDTFIWQKVGGNSMTEIKSGNNQFFIEEDGEVIARIEFIPSGTDVNGRDLIIVNHTIVYEGYNDRGLGRKLVNRLAEYARDRKKVHYPSMPLCKKCIRK